jgi:hypothetical protein
MAGSEKKVGVRSTGLYYGMRHKKFLRAQHQYPNPYAGQA